MYENDYALRRKRRRNSLGEFDDVRGVKIVDDFRKQDEIELAVGPASGNKHLPELDVVEIQTALARFVQRLGRGVYGEQPTTASRQLACQNADRASDLKRARVENARQRLQRVRVLFAFIFA
jgi:hypothetical protein